MRELDGLRAALAGASALPWVDDGPDNFSADDPEWVHVVEAASPPAAHGEIVAKFPCGSPDDAAHTPTSCDGTVENGKKNAALAVLAVNLAAPLAAVAEAAEAYMDSDEGADEIERAKALRVALSALKAAAASAGKEGARGE